MYWNFFFFICWLCSYLKNPPLKSEVALPMDLPAHQAQIAFGNAFTPLNGHVLVGRGIVFISSSLGHFSYVYFQVSHFGWALSFQLVLLCYSECIYASLCISRVLFQMFLEVFLSFSLLAYLYLEICYFHKMFQLCGSNWSCEPTNSHYR